MVKRRVEHASRCCCSTSDNVGKRIRVSGCAAHVFPRRRVRTSAFYIFVFRQQPFPFCAEVFVCRSRVVKGGDPGGQCAEVISRRHHVAGRRAEPICSSGMTAGGKNS